MIAFSEALEALKRGKKVARRGWNGKGMFIYLHKGSLPADVEYAGGFEGIEFKLFEDGDCGTIPRLPSIAFKTATGSTLIGWLASQSDILAEDWIIL